MKKIMILVATLTSLVSCNNNDKKNVTEQSIKKATIDSMDYANRQQRMIDSLQALTQSSSKNLEMESPAMIPIEEGHKKVKPRKKITLVKPIPAVNTPQTTNNTPAQPQSGSAGNTTPVPADNSTVVTAPTKKKGLNNAAKGAIIGLGTGAAAGAIIGKENRSEEHTLNSSHLDLSRMPSSA